MIVSFDDIIHKDSHVLVALSGGPDSMYLLHLLKTYREKVPFDLRAAHLHHGLRETADRDQAFVESLCEEWDVPLIVERADVKAYARENKLGTEEAGRILRYDFFRRNKAPGGLIALAHHLDDQVETMLLRLIRGTGLRGMEGMKVLEGDLFRPLLSLTKEEILAALEKNHIPYVVDETNLEPTYSRNRVRLNMIPEAEAINPGFRRAMETFRTMAEEDEGYLSREAEKIYGSLARESSLGVSIDVEIFSAPDALRRRIFRRAAERIKGHVKNIGYEHILSIDELKEAQTGKGLDLPGLRVARSYDKIIFSPPPAGTEQVDAVSLIDGEAEFMGHRFYLGEGEDFIYVKDPSRVSIRTRRPGDAIRLKVGRKKLKDVFIDAKINRVLRDSWPVVVEGGEVIWVVGLRKAYRQEEKSWQKLAWIPSKEM